MLQRNINIRADPIVRSNRFEQAASDLIRVSVQEPNPAQLFDAGQFLQQYRQTVFEA